MKKLLTVFLAILITFTCIVINISAEDEKLEIVNPNPSAKEEILFKTGEELDLVNYGVDPVGSDLRYFYSVKKQGPKPNEVKVAEEVIKEDVALEVEEEKNEVEDVEVINTEVLETEAKEEVLALEVEAKGKDDKPGPKQEVDNKPKAKDFSTTAKAKEAGDYIVYWTLCKANEKKDAPEKNALDSAEIHEIEVSISAAPYAKDNLYVSDKEQELINKGTNPGKGKDFYYCLGDENITPTDPNQYKKEVPKAKDAGSYFVYWVLCTKEDMTAEKFEDIYKNKIEVDILKEPTSYNTVSINGLVTECGQEPSTKGSAEILVGVEKELKEAIDKEVVFKEEKDLVGGKLAEGKKYSYEINLEADNKFVDEKDLKVVVNGIEIEKKDIKVDKDNKSKLQVKFSFSTPNKEAVLHCMIDQHDYDGEKFIPAIYVTDVEGENIPNENIKKVKYEQLNDKDEWKPAEGEKDLINAGQYRAVVELKKESAYDFVVNGVASKVAYFPFVINKAPLEVSLKDEEVLYNPALENQNPVIIGMVDVNGKEFVGKQVEIPNEDVNESKEEDIESKEEDIKAVPVIVEEDNKKFDYTYTYVEYASLLRLKDIAGEGHYRVYVDLNEDIAKNYYFIDEDFEDHIELDYYISDGKVVLYPSIKGGDSVVYNGANHYVEVLGMDEVCHEEEKGLNFGKMPVIIKDYDLTLQVKLEDGSFEVVEGIKDAGEYRVVLSLNAKAQENFKFDITDDKTITEPVYAMPFYVVPKALDAVEVFPFEAVANFGDTAEMSILNYEDYDEGTKFEILKVGKESDAFANKWYDLFHYEGNFLVPAGTYQIRVKANPNYTTKEATTFVVKETAYKHAFGNISIVKGANSVTMVCDYDYEITWYKNEAGRWMYEDNVKEVTINGVTIPSEYYTLVKGSTEVTFNKDFIKNLNTGAYLIGIHYENGMHVEAYLTVKDNNGGSVPYVAPNTCVK